MLPRSAARLGKACRRAKARKHGPAGLDHKVMDTTVTTAIKPIRRAASHRDEMPSSAESCVENEGGTEYVCTYIMHDTQQRLDIGKDQVDHCVSVSTTPSGLHGPSVIQSRIGSTRQVMHSRQPTRADRRS